MKNKPVNWLITADELHTLSGRSDVVIVDCRFSLANTSLGESQYRENHIPESHYFHLDRDMSAPLSHHGGRHPLPDKQTFAQRLRNIGVNNESLVVCYDDQRMAFASRLWWLLRWLGHDNVRVLNGGYSAWQKKGFSVSVSVKSVAPGNFNPAKSQVEMVDHDYVSNLDANDVNTALIDSREAIRYRGDQETIDPIAGHIPNALNKPWAEATTADGAMLNADKLSEHWQDISDKKEVIVYCGSGVTACVNVLSLAMIGREDIKLYAGSWSDWCSYLI